MKCLSKARHSQLTKYIEELQSTLHLNNWHIQVARYAESVKRPKNIGRVEAAWTTVSGFGPEAMIQVSDYLFEIDRDCQRRILVHELCHLVMAPVNHVVEDFPSSLSKKEQRFFEATYNRAMEYAVDQYAHMIHEQCPLPPKWKS